MWCHHAHVAVHYGCITPAQVPLRVTNMPPKRMYPVPVWLEYCSVLHSHYVFFDCKSEEAAHTDRQQSRQFTFRCR